MALSLVHRKEYSRRSPSGRMIIVSAHWAIYERDSKKEKRSYQHDCPECGAAIISVSMPNRGWAHFEAKKGITRVKHPCLHRGENIQKGNIKDIEDLFEYYEK